MILEQLADLLEDSGLGTVGTNLFIGELPTGKESATMLISIPSPQPDNYTGIQYQDFDIWARDGSESTGYSNLLAIFTLLDRMNDVFLPDYHISYIEALGNIDDLDRDDEGRKLWKQSYRLTYRNLDLIS